jgi:hypothetical protein
MRPDSTPIPTNAMMLKARCFSRADPKPRAMADKGVSRPRPPAALAETAAHGPGCGVGYGLTTFFQPAGDLEFSHTADHRVHSFFECQIDKIRT